MFPIENAACTTQQLNGLKSDEPNVLSNVFLLESLSTVRTYSIGWYVLLSNVHMTCYLPAVCYLASAG